MAARNSNLSGKKFGRWTAIAKAGAGKWLCRCECGVSRPVNTKNLKSGASSSCGCLQREITRASAYRLTHGKANTPTWISWQRMKQRCLYKGAASYASYGGAGITVCDRWLSFENFLADMGERPQGKTLDRIDNRKGYEPGNCRWATQVQQERNKTNNRIVIYSGKARTLAEVAEITGVNYFLLFDRIVRYGWSVDKAVNTPKRR